MRNQEIEKIISVIFLIAMVCTVVVVIGIMSTTHPNESTYYKQPIQTPRQNGGNYANGDKDADGGYQP